MTRTSRARIRPFTRYCGCRLNQAPDRRNGSAAQRRVFFFRNFGETNRFPEALYEAVAARTKTTGPQYREPRGVVSNILLFSKANLICLAAICAPVQARDAAPPSGIANLLRMHFCLGGRRIAQDIQLPGYCVCRSSGTAGYFCVQLARVHDERVVLPHRRPRAQRHIFEFNELPVGHIRGLHAEVISNRR
jgi:hypothetical protein